MSLLDDAREILNRGPESGEYPCQYCCFIPHQEECPWLSMPKIVAALEIVGRAIDGMREHPIECEHGGTCEWRTLLALFKGEDSE